MQTYTELRLQKPSINQDSRGDTRRTMRCNARGPHSADTHHVERPTKALLRARYTRRYSATRFASRNRSASTTEYELRPASDSARDAASARQHVQPVEINSSGASPTRASLRLIELEETASRSSETYGFSRLFDRPKRDQSCKPRFRLCFGHAE